MNALLLFLTGLSLGLLVTIWMIRQLLKHPKGRLWLSRHTSFNQSNLPESSTWIIRHGQWSPTANPNHQDTP